MIILGTISVGLAVFLMGIDEQKALALGPGGPLMEDFWENMRRYGLYALTVSTGVLYSVFQPIVELLRNPISAILVLTIIGGSIFIVSQVVSAMVGFLGYLFGVTEMVWMAKNDVAFNDQLNVISIVKRP
ncbi:hypothetical protein Fot_39249 [Forsythia ovata]|uniref:Uncharacterized protein ycf33 n=1 Tax=Forsythia ovata TaxID=205694 RepID=A0ABD1S430_9LAMI